MTTAYDTIAHLDPCSNAARWLRTQPDAQTAWNACESPDWMIWLLGEIGTPKATLVTLAVHFARSVLHLVPAGEERPRLAIEAAERWLADPSDENRRDATYAANAADVAYAAANAANAANAADAAAYAAYATDADNAADAVHAADAAFAAAYATARKSQCDMIRELVPVIRL